MKSIGAAILGAATFAALTLGVEHDADACNTIPPEDDCAVTKVGEHIYYAKLLQTVSTTPGQNCGCGLALGNLPEGKVVNAGVFTLGGQTTGSFCGSGVNAQTTSAFQSALGGVDWSNAVLNAVSAAGVTGGQPTYGIFKIHAPTGQFGGAIGVGQVNFGPGGTVTLDAQHQAVAQITCPVENDCATNPGLRACQATTTARQYLDTAPGAPAKVAVKCAVTDAPTLLGLPLDDDEMSADGGGCSASGNRGVASLLLLGLVGAVLAIGRARRRA